MSVVGADFANYYAGLPESELNNGEGCGRCIRFSYGGKCHQAQVVNKCYSCQPGQIGVSNQLVNFFGIAGWPLPPVEWEFVPCDSNVSGSIRMDTGLTVNEYWQEVSFSNLRKGIKSVSIAGTPLSRSTYGTWVWDKDTPHAINTRLALRLVADDDQVLTTNIDGSRAQWLTAQFTAGPAVCPATPSPNPSPRPSPPLTRSPPPLTRSPPPLTRSPPPPTRSPPPPVRRPPPPTRSPPPPSPRPSPPPPSPRPSPPPPPTPRPSPPPPSSTKATYMDLLGKSYLFYEVQRSGKLPPNNRISYRGDSFLTDEVVGGYFDAGDHLKLNFPMHNAMVILGWSLLEFPQAHADAGQTTFARNTLKWATDYIIACHRSEDEYVGQIGDFTADHQYWGRPEEQTGPRPAWVWDASQPATDLLCSAASALTVAHLVFKTSDPAYSTACLTHAEQLYRLGTASRGKYSDFYPSQTQGYTSNTYLDDLALAAAWLYKATGEQQYLADARSALQEAQFTRNPFVSWDAVFPLADLLLKSQGVANSAGVDLDWQIAHFRYSWMGKKDDGTVDPNPQIKITRKGLAVAPLGGWGTLRYALNAAFGFVLDAKYTTDPERRAESLAFAKQQLEYALGSAGRSYVVGHGNSFPVQPHHRSASCPDLPASCGWDQFNSLAPNPQVLSGAMVAGPANDDSEYEDKRSDFKSNEVSLDFNAGYTGTLAGLIQML